MALETIYMPMLDEGTPVWRPVDAERLPDGTFLILGPMPEDEEWAFKPKERVIAETRESATGSQLLTAIRRMAEQTSCPQNWEEVEQLIARCIAESPDPFSPCTVANAQDLFVACFGRCPTPMEVAKGYWNTICISWDKIQVEIFDDRYEYYHFREGATDIEYFDHKGGAEFPRELLDRLPCRKIET